MRLAATAPRPYERHRPEQTTLYAVVRDNLETLYGAIDEGALDVKVSKHARKELEAYLDCGRLCRGFARLRCGSCGESRLVAFSCKGRGFCPSCLGRQMCATLNPHLHVVFLDGVYREDGAELTWQPLGHLQTREIGAVLERAVRRMARYLRRRSALVAAAGDDDGAGMHLTSSHLGFCRRDRKPRFYRDERR